MQPYSNRCIELTKVMNAKEMACINDWESFSRIGQLN